MPTVPTWFQHGGTSGTPLKPLRDDSALRALSSLTALRGAPEVPPLCRETSVSRTANVGTVGMNGLNDYSGLELLIKIHFILVEGTFDRNFIRFAHL